MAASRPPGLRGLELPCHALLLGPSSSMLHVRLILLTVSAATRTFVSVRSVHACSHASPACAPLPRGASCATKHNPSSGVYLASPAVQDSLGSYYDCCLTLTMAQVRTQGRTCTATWPHSMHSVQPPAASHAPRRTGPPRLCRRLT